MDNSLNVFIEEYEFLTSFYCGDLSVNEMQISLKFSEVFPYKITGSLTGTVKKYNELVPLINNQIQDKKLTFNSESFEKQYKIFSSDSVNLPSFIYPHGYPKSVSFEIGKLELRNLRISQNFNNNTEKRIKFYLVGPQRIWNFMGRHEVKDDKIEFKDFLKIDIDEDLPFDLKLEVIKFDKPDEYEKKLTHSYEVMSLTFIQKTTHNHVNDNELLELCTSYVNDILLLVSFCGRKRIEWFCYKFYSEKEIITFIKENRNIDKSEPGLDDAFLGNHNTLKFIKQTLPTFRKLRRDNFDLTKAIRYYLSGLEMPYLESEFSTLFTSLECIKSLYANKNEIDLLMNGSKFKNKISKQLKKEIMRLKEGGIDFPEEEMIKKMPELNRTAISTIINKLTAEYSIKIKSLYPKEEKITLYDTRNKITHSSNSIDIEILFKEYLRLQILIEMLILKILNWDDLSNFYECHEMKLVTG